MPSKRDPAPQYHTLALVIASDPHAVRDGLRAMVARPPLSDLPEDQRGVVELVLAEVLNNIVEHAYATTTGTIEIELESIACGIACRVVDQGVTMAGNTLPPDTLPAGIGGLTDDLPEGGFGWHLIRRLTCDMTYERRDGCNFLAFVIPNSPH